VNNIALFHKQFFCFGAYCFDQRFGEELFAVELRNALVKINACWMLSVMVGEESVVDAQGRPGIAAQRYHVAARERVCKRSGSQE